MTRDSTLITHSDLPSLSRLQLQALCVKAGLDSTAENEELKKILQEHWTQHQQDSIKSEVTVNNEEIHGDTRPTDSDEMGTIVFEKDIKVTTDTNLGVVIERSEDRLKSIDAAEASEGIKQEGVGVENGIAVPSVAKTVIKTEKTLQASGDTIMEDMSQSNTEITDNVFIKHEAMDETVLPREPENPIVVKQEQDDITIKSEDNKAEIPVKMESTEEKLKVDDTTISISHRKQFWESKTSFTRSTLPISKDRPASQITTPAGTRSAIGQTRQTSHKRSREAEDPATNGEIKDEDNQDNGSGSSPFPTPGTVRNLIGKFAGSTINPPGTSSSKRRKTEAVKSSPAVSGAPTIPRYKRVIKIPVAGTATSKSAYALGNSKPGSTPGSTATARRKVASSSPSSSPAPSSAKKTAVSVETINRLAMPKKVNTAPALGAGTAPVAPPSFIPAPTTPTRPRGPILSTASRAAQRRNREKK
ncbi:hypothetical protein BGX27_008195 [Mortierella sp. AM989]|nr:hypothetical protein BGX27_008195 [Mortierella sp. AM989]